MNDPYAAYLESNVLCATPLELIRMLYGAALDAVRTARACLEKKQIAERSQAVSRAVEILTELNNSVDPSAGELSNRLTQLYDYVQRRLLESNFQQADGPFAEAQQLLETLAEAWQTVPDPHDQTDKPAPVIETAANSDPASGSPWDEMMSEPHPVREYATEGWTL